jgi:hypothetical protein
VVRAWHDRRVLTLALYGLLAVVVVVVLFLVVASLLPAGEQIAAPIRDEPPWQLPPARRLAAAEIAAVRLPVALRGYRFAETDLLLDRLGEELRERDAEIARLRGVAEPPDAGRVTEPARAEPAEAGPVDEPSTQNSSSADDDR